MTMAVIETWVNQDLKQPVRMIYPKGNFFENDNLGNLVGVKVYNNNVPATLSGSVVGYCVLSSGVSVAVNGTLSGNAAYIILPQLAYSFPGIINIIIKLVNGSTVTTLAAICTTVIGIGSSIDPGTEIIAQWTAQINAAIATVEGNSVRYDTSQSLTSTQKQQARDNIGDFYTVQNIENDDYLIIVP